MIIEIASLAHQFIPVLKASDLLISPSPSNVRVPMNALGIAPVSRTRAKRPTSRKLPNFGSIFHRPLKMVTPTMYAVYTAVPGKPHQEGLAGDSSPLRKSRLK